MLCLSSYDTQGFTIVAVYQDGGQSGDLPMDCRQEGVKLLEAIKRGEVDVVIVNTSDRLSRNLAHSVVLRQQWRQAGIELHYVDRGKLGDNAEARLSENVHAVIAEYEREKIRMRTMAGKRNKVKAGKWLGVSTPYGYRREGKGGEARIFVYQLAAAIVRAIFGWYAWGDGDGSGPLAVSAICRRLQERGILPPETAMGRSDNREWIGQPFA